MRATSSRQYTQVIFSLSLWCSGCRGISPFILVSSRQAAAVHLYLDLLFSDSLFGNSDTVFLFLSVYTFLWLLLAWATPGFFLKGEKKVIIIVVANFCSLDSSSSVFFYFIAFSAYKLMCFSAVRLAVHVWTIFTVWMPSSFNEYETLLHSSLVFRQQCQLLASPSCCCCG